MPWWGAVLIAVTASAIGFAFDAGSGTKELTGVFAAMFAIGCVAAVLAVRQAGLFTAVVQPPVLLFITVPGAYFLFHSGEITGLKDILINCGYPLIERFPIMLCTSAGVLLIGLLRWYLGRHAPAEAQGTDAAQAIAGRLSALVATLSSRFFSKRGAAEEEAETTGRRRHARDRPPAKATTRTARSANSGTSARTARRAKTTEPARPRRTRRPLTDVTEFIEPVVDRPRRSRTTPREEPPVYPRRRRAATGREGLRGDPYERRERYGRRPPYDGRGRHDAYDPYESYEPPPRRRPASNVNGNGANGTHHPISRVRYRSNGPTDNGPTGYGRSENGRPEPPPWPRSRSWEADTWEYDI